MRQWPERGTLRSWLPRGSRQWVIIVHDLVMAALSFAAAFILRFGTTNLDQQQIETLFKGIPLFALIAAVSFTLFGVYREVWRYASIGNLLNIMKASTLAILVFFLAAFTIKLSEQIPRSVPIIQWFILIVMVGGPRFTYRLLVKRRQTLLGLDGAPRPPRIPVLLIGGGEAAALFIRALDQDHQMLYRAVGLLGDDRAERGRHIHNVPVLGTLDELLTAVQALERRGSRPQRLVITEPLPAATMQALIEQAEALKLISCRLPSLTEFKTAFDDGRLELKPIAIEDLLGRPQAVLDQAAIGALIAGKRVLITGAGGSIGSELARQIARRDPAALLLVDNGEFNLYAIDHEIHEQHRELTCSSVYADIRDRARIMRLFEDWRPQLVFHAAALKHVPLVELNPGEGVLTNVMGTRNVADATRAVGALAMVQISTDKAVNPTNVMGATKRLAEFYCQALDLERQGRPAGIGATRFMTVRFGNVLGSSGSVVPLFQRQLAHGGPLTVTHPEIKRYFMTVGEAVELVLQASAHGLTHDEHRGQIFVLDMGNPVKIVDVARQMIRLAGLEPDVDVTIEFVGLRPGEKLFEELFDTAEQRLPAGVSGVLAATSRSIPLALLRQAFAELGDAAGTGDEQAVRHLIAQIIPGYDQSAGDRRHAAA